MSKTKTLEREWLHVYHFKATGTFDAVYEARQWCRDNGYSYGSMARDMPIAIMKGDYDIAKWYNLSVSEKASVDGVIISDDFREGDVKIIIYK